MSGPTTGYLVFDLETVPDSALYTPPAEGERPFAPLHAQQVVAVGALRLDGRYRLVELSAVGEAAGADEAALLGGLSRAIQRARPTLVTFNGRGFDLPVLVLRSLRHGLSLPWYFEEPRYRERRDETGHIDLFDALALHGAARRSVSLDSAARLIGLPGKLEVDGSQVEALHAAGELETIRRYCLADVAQTALLLLRYHLLQGRLDRPRYGEAAADLLRALEADGRLQPLLDHIERDRLLLS
jgi:predicted PolB exonuclease-like 3'-5' exonuclease